MEEYYVVYWSQTGNTKEMAEAVGAGIEEAGKRARVVEVGSVSSEELMDKAVFALGCPAMGAEVLEEEEMEPFVAEVEKFASGKRVALFGSYGWGDGEWMRDWEARMTKAGAEVIGGAGVMCNEAPNADAVAACKALGARMIQ